MSTALWRVRTSEGPQLARGDPEHGPAELLAGHLLVSDFLTDDGDLFSDLGNLPAAGAVPSPAVVLAPVDQQPVWAAGVTFTRSRQARKEESVDGGDIYDRVYAADRPELFFKALPGDVVDPGQPVGIRVDSTWNVPEPELAVLVGSDGGIRAFTLGNDMSSRSLEGENPLYLPQAKVYDRSCALGPCLVPVGQAPPWRELTIVLTILRGSQTLYADSVDLGAMHRTPGELIEWLLRCTSSAHGVALLTGTSIVPPGDITVADHDRVIIRASGLGELANPVCVVGKVTRSE